MRIAHYGGALTIHEWSGVLMSMMSGFHWSAARTLRWIFETGIAVGAACTNGNLLATSFTPGRPTSISGFRDWLKKYDDPNTGTKLKRTDIMRALYANESEVRHTVVNANPPMFKRVYRLALRTCDVVLFCLVQSFAAITKMDRDFVGWTDSYRFHSFGRNMHPKLRSYAVRLLWNELPMTWRVVNRIANLDSDPIPIRFSWRKYGVSHRIVEK